MNPDGTIDRLTRVIWEASHKDEGTISGIGATVVAVAVVSELDNIFGDEYSELRQKAAAWEVVANHPAMKDALKLGNSYAQGAYLVLNKLAAKNQYWIPEIGDWVYHCAAGKVLVLDIADNDEYVVWNQQIKIRNATMEELTGIENG